jgi:hypothetical protein
VGRDRIGIVTETGFDADYNAMAATVDLIPDSSLCTHSLLAPFVARRHLRSFRSALLPSQRRASYQAEIR